jgi:hypothetical protein
MDAGEGDEAAPQISGPAPAHPRHMESAHCRSESVCTVIKRQQQKTATKDSSGLSWSVQRRQDADQRRTHSLCYDEPLLQAALPRRG